jgi:hypothetical protein
MLKSRCGKWLMAYGRGKTPRTSGMVAVEAST